MFKKVSLCLGMFLGLASVNGHAENFPVKTVEGVEVSASFSELERAFRAAASSAINKVLDLGNGQYLIAYPSVLVGTETVNLLSSSDTAKFACEKFNFSKTVSYDAAAPQTRSLATLKSATVLDSVWSSRSYYWELAIPHLICEK